MALDLTATGVTRTAGSITDIIGEIAGFGVQVGGNAAVRWAARFAAGLIPGGGVIIPAIELMLPYIAKVAQAAPAVKKALDAGMPIAAAIDAHGGDVLHELRSIVAIAINHDPERAETNMVAAQVRDADLQRMAGPVLIGRRLTQEEENRWMDRFNSTGDSAA